MYPTVKLFLFQPDLSLEEAFGAPRFTFFVPCLNEEPRIAATLETLRTAMEEVGGSYEILVVDDGSTDGTSAAVEAYRQNHPEMVIHLHRNPVNYGVAHSFVEAAFRGKGIYYRLIWGDNVEPRETMVAILSLAGKADIIVPYYPHVPGKGPLRMGFSHFYTGLVNALSGFSLRYYNGSLLCRRYHAMRWSPHSHGFTGFLADLITQLLAEGATCIEIPVLGRHQDKKGERNATPITPKNLVSTALTLIAILSRRISYRVFKKKGPKV